MNATRDPRLRRALSLFIVSLLYATDEPHSEGATRMASSILGTIIIGFLAGLLARFFASDPRNPEGCLLTTVLGIAGAALFTWLGQQIGLYERGDQAGFIGAVLGSVLVLLIWRAAVSARK